MANLQATTIRLQSPHRVYGSSVSTGAIIAAAIAAPTYFEPWTIREDPEPPSDCERVGTLVDGGVAGNPVYRACIEAFY